MAQLMFRIANEAHPDVRTYNASLPDCLVAIIDKAMTKDVAARYQTGAEMARDLRACMAGGTPNGAASVDISLE
jgi:serine/threonine-protein kinase